MCVCVTNDCMRSHTNLKWHALKTGTCRTTHPALQRWALWLCYCLLVRLVPEPTPSADRCVFFFFFSCERVFCLAPLPVASTVAGLVKRTNFGGCTALRVHTRTQTHILTHTHTHTYTLTFSLTLALAHSHSHTLTHAVMLGTRREATEEAFECALVALNSGAGQRRVWAEYWLLVVGRIQAGVFAGDTLELANR